MLGSMLWCSGVCCGVQEVGVMLGSMLWCSGSWCDVGKYVVVFRKLV